MALCKYSTEEIEQALSEKKKLNYSFKLYDIRQFLEVVYSEAIKGTVSTLELYDKIFGDISHWKTHMAIDMLRSGNWGES